MATIKDVAKLAGVSHGTVSNILKGHKGVKFSKVQMVEAAIKELGYQPDATARSLKTNRTMNVGVVLPNIIDACYSQIFTGIERILSNNKYTVSLYITSDVPANEKTILKQIQQQRMDGLIIASCQPHKAELFQNLLNSDMKLVFIEREIENKDYNFIGFNNKTTIYNAVIKMLKEKSRVIAIIAGPSEYSCENSCVEAYKQAFKECNVEINKKLIEITNIDKQSSFRAAFRLMQLGEIPDVIFTTSTQIAEGVIEAMKFFDPGLIKKPLIASLSEDSWTNSSYPEIIKLPRRAIYLGEQSAEILLENINHSAFYENKNTLLENSDTSLPKVIDKPATSAKNGSKSTLKVLMLDSSSSYATYSLLPDFKKKFGAHVHIDALPYNELYEVIKDEKQSAAYDVFQLDIPWLPEFVERGILSNISSFIKHNTKSIDGLIPGILDSYAKYNDSFYVMPYMYGTQLLFYRKDFFEDNKLQRLFYEEYKTELMPPKTWAEYNAIAKFFTRAFNDQSPTLYGTTLGGRFSSGAVCEFLPRMWAYGGDTFNSLGNVVFDSKESIRALNNYCESYQYASPTSPDHWWNEQVVEFCNGDAAMMVLFMSHATDISDRSKSKVVGKVGYDSVPGGNPLLGGWSLGINNASKNKNLSFDFISWASSKDLAIPQTILGGSTPCVNLYNSSELGSVYPWLPKALDSFGISRKRAMPRSLSGLVISERQYEEILGEAVHDAIIKKVSSENAINSAAYSLRELIIKNTK